MPLISAILDIIYLPFSVFVFLLVSLSAINKSVGVRRAYVKLLLKVFEYGRQSIETASEQIKDGGPVVENIIDGYKVNSANHSSQYESNDKSKSNGSVLISRDSVLQPTLQTNHTSAKDGVESTQKLKDEINFDLETCLDYIRTGVEAIIEDEVTSRFEAEELKSWNLLTRTNRHYEFISWKITLIWMIGFTIRYFILMPLRVFVCFLGVAVAVVTNSLVAFLPFQFLRHYCADLSYKLSFRLITASLSAVIKFHNTEYKPKASGFCVANHTSPLDVGVLSTDCTFSLVVWLTVCTAIVGCLSEGDYKREMVNKVLRHCFSVLSSAISAVIIYHNAENRPTKGICVANHTSPIDVLVLMSDTTYSLIGQRHGGFLGIMQRALARASPHIWFERGEAKDRHAVAERLRQHVSDPSNPPILIFPEGTCINNTSVMQFKKGSFEVGGVIYPVAIKYDPRFGDAFWNSSKYSMIQYLYMMMTSWAIVCDVWYLPPMYRQEGESAVDFANRVKSVIAKQGGLVDLVWDGQLKRMKPKKEWKEMQQIEFTKRLKGD
ncbi:glycerol-3-phosphate acyltransferase 3 isoform X3 [Teleopsis dalmanni]|uniref:glycerol-3-phosphate acyltransferase 3 isoform X3 n=1 Tax=Teleopsis dalmanni TaxID=139649 RepID=UPI0018CE0C74|nr:glycerol-3-phosphate acyltransferase 3 isoform X3 [Teleopsis dalmanni]